MQLKLQWWSSVRCCCCHRSARRPRRSAGLTNSTSFFTSSVVLFRGTEEEKEEEEKDEEGTVPLLLFMTSSTILSSHILCSVSGCCLTCTGLLDFWEMTSVMFLYSTLCLVRRWIHAHASVYVTFGRFLWYFLRPLVSGSRLLTLSVPEEYSYAVFWEMTSGYAVFNSLLVSTVDTFFVSLRRPGDSTHFVA